MGDRRRTTKLIALLVLLALVQPVFAQRFAADSRNYFDYGDESYVTSRQSPTADSIRIYVNTANALFSFIKTDRAHSARGTYYAVRDVSVELRESPVGKVLATHNNHDTIFAKEFSETTSKEHWNSLVIAMPVEAIAHGQSVEIHTEIRDGFLVRLADKPSNETIVLRSFNRIRSVTAKDTSYIGIADPILFDANTEGCTYCSRNFGATTEFSRDLTGAVALTLPAGEQPDSIVVTLKQESDALHTQQFQPVVVATTTVSAADLLAGRALAVATVDSMIAFMTVPRSDSALSSWLAIFHFSGGKFEQGAYTITVKAYRGPDTRTVQGALELEWHDMPLSLESVRDALPPMQYILSDDEYSKLSSGSSPEEMRKLFEYWKAQDPTPKTAFNERMAEFYRRADYAYFNFAHGSKLLDGAMTDRGKIYILFGPPTNIQRSFLVGESPMEIWTYSNNVKKVFKFVGQSSTDFKLVGVKPL